MFPRGIYVLVVEVPEKTIEVGKLGKMKFKGRYAYVGSNQKGGRIERHLKRGKKKKWHIDYLTEEGEVKKVIVIELPKEFEERLAERLAEKFKVIKGFGNSDCRDPGHLFVFSEKIIEEVKKFARENGKEAILFEIEARWPA